MNVPSGKLIVRVKQSLFNFAQTIFCLVSDEILNGQCISSCCYVSFNNSNALNVSLQVLLVKSIYYFCELCIGLLFDTSDTFVMKPLNQFLLIFVLFEKLSPSSRTQHFTPLCLISNEVAFHN